MALFNKEKNILAADYQKGVLNIFDINEKSINSVNPDGKLVHPTGICVGINKNGDEEIFISDVKERTIFVFNTNLKFIKKIGEDLNDVFFIDVYSSTNTILCCSHPQDNMITFWNVNDEKLIKSMSIEQPIHLKIGGEKLYVLSTAECELDDQTRKVINLDKGNYINVINIAAFEIVHKIQFQDWFSPHALYLSSDSSIYTLAYEIDKNGICSKNRFLFIVDSANYKIKQKIKLKDIDTFSDMMYLNKKLVLTGVNEKMNKIVVIELNI